MNRTIKVRNAVDHALNLVKLHNVEKTNRSTSFTHGCRKLCGLKLTTVLMSVNAEQNIIGGVVTPG